MKKSISLLVGLLVLGVGCAPVSSASLRLANGGNAQVSVLPTDRGTHNVSVTVPASGQIDWASVEVIEPERPGSRVAAHVLMGVGLAGLVIGAAVALGSTPDSEREGSGNGWLLGLLTFGSGGVLALSSVPLYVASALAMGETRRLVEGARANHVQAAESAPAPTVVVEHPAAPVVESAEAAAEPESESEAGESVDEPVAP